MELHLKQFKELTIFQSLELLYTSKKKNNKAMVYFVDDEDAPQVELIGVNYESSRPFLFHSYDTGEQERLTGNRVFIEK